jgi:hypothetical protein
MHVYSYCCDKLDTWFGLIGPLMQARVNVDRKDEDGNPNIPAIRITQHDWIYHWFCMRGWSLYLVIHAMLLPVLLLECSVYWTYHRLVDCERTKLERYYRVVANIDGSKVPDTRVQRIINECDVMNYFEDVVIDQLNGCYERRSHQMLYSGIDDGDKGKIGMFVRDYHMARGADFMFYRLAGKLRLKSHKLWVNCPYYYLLFRPKTLERLTVLMDLLLIWIGYTYFVWWQTILVIVAWWSLVMHVKVRFDYP